MATTAAQTYRARQGGVLTVFTYGGKIITFAAQIGHVSPAFVGDGSQNIQPIDEPYTVQIIVPVAAGPGTLTLGLYDLFGKDASGNKIWDRLGASIAGSSLNNPYGSTTSNNQSTSLAIGSGPFAGLVDIVDIAIKQAQLDPTQTQVVKYIRPLPTYGQPSTPYSEEYHNCVITDVKDGETIQVGTLSITKQITIQYTYMSRNNVTSQAFALRDAAL